MIDCFFKLDFELVYSLSVSRRFVLSAVEYYPAVGLCEKFDMLTDLYYQVNSVVNISGLKTVDDVYIKHYLDSAYHWDKFSVLYYVFVELAHELARDGYIAVDKLERRLDGKCFAEERGKSAASAAFI